MKRKDFLQYSSVLAGGFLLPSPWIKRSNNDAPILQLGIIGCGDRGQGIISILKGLPELFNIKAACDVLEFRRAATQKLVNPSCKILADYKSLLDDKSIDAVVIAVPLYLH